MGFSRERWRRNRPSPSRTPKENCFQHITKSSDKPSIRWAGRKVPMYSLTWWLCGGDSGLSPSVTLGTCLVLGAVLGCGFLYGPGVHPWSGTLAASDLQSSTVACTLQVSTVFQTLLGQLADLHRWPFSRHNAAIEQRFRGRWQWQEHFQNPYRLPRLYECTSVFKQPHKPVTPDMLP